MMPTVTCGNNIFKKGITNIWGTALGRFSQCFFLIFWCRSTIAADIYTQPLHHVKASYISYRDKIIIARQHCAVRNPYIFKYLKNK